MSGPEDVNYNHGWVDVDDLIDEFEENIGNIGQIGDLVSQAEGSASAATTAKTASETARDAAIAAGATVGTYASTTAGLAAVAEGARFWAPNGTDALQQYTKTGGVAVAVAGNAIPTASAENLGRSANYLAKPAPNLVADAGNGTLAGWQPSSASAVLARVLSASGRPAISISGAASVQVYHNILVPAGATKFSYNVALESKTVSTGRILIAQYSAIAAGNDIAGGTELARTTITLPTGATSTRTPYSGTVDLVGGPVRVVVYIDTQAAGEVVFSEAMIAFDAFAVYRDPALGPRLVDGKVSVGVPRAVVSAATGLIVTPTPRITHAQDGALNVGGFGGASGALFTAASDFVISGGAWEIAGAVTMTALASSAGGVMFGLGDIASDTFRMYSYFTNGTIVRLTKAQVSTALGTGATFGVGDRVGLRLLRNEDGTGTLTAAGPTGSVVSIDLTDIPAGTLHYGWRAGGSGVIHGLSATPVPVDYRDLRSRVSVLEGSRPSLGAAAKLEGWRQLPTPASRPGRVPAGWTCTGACVVPTGAFAGAFAVADDGRMIGDDGTPNVPAIHIVDRDCNTVLRTIEGGYGDYSAQGVAWNPLSSHLVLATYDDRKIRSYDLYASGSPEVTAAQIDLGTDLGIATVRANALAFDEARGTSGRCWLGIDTTTTVYEVDMATKAVISTKTLTSIPDHFCLLSDKRRLLYVPNSGNGVTATLRLYDLVANTDTLICSLPGSQAPEGGWLDEAAGIWYQFNDGGYHPTASPALNIVARYTIPALPA